jgi:hypothetical protein
MAGATGYVLKQIRGTDLVGAVPISRGTRIAVSERMTKVRSG